MEDLIGMAVSIIIFSLCVLLLNLGNRWKRRKGQRGQQP